MEQFPRHLYYSQTDVLRGYRISAKAYQALLEERGIEPVKRVVVLDGYQVETVYVLISEVEKLNLEQR
jgi:3-mercaptopyruvate sulfurtransferase SseA